MEILVLALGYVIVGPMMVGITLMANMIAMAVSIVVQLVFLPVEIAVEGAVSVHDAKKQVDADKKQAETVATDPEAAERRKVEEKRQRERWRKFTTGLAAMTGAIFVLTLLAVAVANFFFFQPTLRFTLGYVRHKTGIAVDFDTAKGNFFTGRVRLDGATVRRPEHPTCRFDLTAERIEMDLSLLDLVLPTGLFKPTVFETLEISKLHGKWEQFGETKTPVIVEDVEPKTEKGRKKRRRFRIDHFTMDDVRLDYIDHARPDADPLHIELVIERLESKPLRSYTALFDVLFRSNLHGTVDGVAYRFEKSEGESRWICNGLPIAVLTSYFGRPFDWFERGTADISIENTWGSGLTMNWSLVFRDFHVKAPEGTSLKAKATMLPLTAYMNRHGEHLPLEFDLKFSNAEKRFDSSPQWREFVRIVVGKEIYEAITNRWKLIEKKDEEQK